MSDFCLLTANFVLRSLGEGGLPLANFFCQLPTANYLIRDEL